MFGRKPESEVLVVGAGPVGLTAALVLNQRGIRVEVMDRDDGRRLEHGCALGLHPETLGLLAGLGVASEVVHQGHRIDTLGLFDRGGRRATIDLSKLPGDFPFLVAIPQRTLEEILVRRLHDQGINVLWSHRMMQVASQADRAEVSVDRLGKEPGGYGVARDSWVVDKTLQRHPSFVIGADGQHSMVRRRIGIEPQAIAKPELFAVSELETDFNLGHELRIMLDEDSTSVLWPLGERRCRWSLELRSGDLPGGDPGPHHGAERTFLDVPEAMFVEMLRERAPWFDGSVAPVAWSVAAHFERHLVDRFGSGRTWLAGDAAHVAGPVGVQSMNVGMREAVDLGSRIAAVLRDHAPLEVLAQYGAEREAEWRPLMGLAPGVVAGAGASDWIAPRAARLLGCVPGSGSMLGAMLAQVGLEPMADTLRPSSPAM